MMHWKMLNQALCPLAKPQFRAGVQNPARISSNSLWALIYWELEKHRRDPRVSKHTRASTAVPADRASASSIST